MNVGGEERPGASPHALSGGWLGIFGWASGHSRQQYLRIPYTLTPAKACNLRKGLRSSAQKRHDSFTTSSYVEAIIDNKGRLEGIRAVRE